MPKPTRLSVLDQFRRSRMEYLKVWLPAIVVVAIGFLIASFFVKPAPPKRIVIATGSKTGAYYAFAQQYAKHFAEAGIELVVRETAGSIENYKLLLDESSDVSIAIVQGGTAPVFAPGQRHETIEAVASLYLEPVWVFHRGAKPFTRIEQLRGRIIAVGGEGSGVRAMALKLLEESGVLAGAAPDPVTHTATRFEPLSGEAAAEALKKGEIDAAVFVISPGSAVVRDLMDEPDDHLMSFELAPAYARRMPFVSSVTLPEGVVDMRANLPPHTTTLIAPAANLVVRGDVHPAVVPLLIEAARDAHERGGLVTEQGAFPSLRYVEFPVNKAADYYFENGRSFLFRVLPFWAATLVDRMKILMLPLLTLLLPMFRIAPPLYRWRVRRRIYRWYRVLKKIDDDLNSADAASVLDDEIARMRQLDTEVNSTIVPLSYMEEFYNLRMHIELTRYRLVERGKEQKKSGAA
jgi:TRAP-type uncharacterized transport system substrate-binding protein